MKWTTSTRRGATLLCFGVLLLVHLAAAAEVAGQWRLLAPTESTTTAGGREAPLPSARCNQCSVYVPSADRLYVFGGNEGVWEFLPLNDLWAFDLASARWAQLAPENTDLPGLLPTKRFRHACVYDEATHSILVFGGMTQDDPINAATVLNDLWKYDIAANSWNEIKPEGQVPPPRYYHVAALQPQKQKEGEGNVMVVFGGIDEAKRLNDLWKYDIATNKWQLAKPSGSRFTPPPLSNPAARATDDGEYLYTFGGQRWWGYQGIINSVFKCHLPTNTWSEVSTKGTPPDPMIGASAVILHGGQSVLVFGGYDVDGFYVNDLHLLNLATSTWLEVKVEGQSVPGKRYAHSAMLKLASADQSMLVFGGYSDFVGNAHNYNDLWQLSIATSLAGL